MGLPSLLGFLRRGLSSKQASYSDPDKSQHRTIVKYGVGVNISEFELYDLVQVTGARDEKRAFDYAAHIVRSKTRGSDIVLDVRDFEVPNIGAVADIIYIVRSIRPAQLSVIGSRELKSALEICDLDKCVPIYQTLNEAVAKYKPAA